MKDVAYNPSALLVVGMLIAAAYTLLGIRYGTIFEPRPPGETGRP